MVKRFDLIVIGTGTAAMTAAMKVRGAGWSVAVIDQRPFGGTCALRGCDPKKMLIGGASAVDHARRMRGKGVDGDARINWPDLMAFKREFTDPVPASHERRYAEKGIATFHGAARFTGRASLAVGEEVLEAQFFLIAAGAEPARLGVPGEELLITNEEFLELGAMPPRVALVGGGYIAAEFSHIAARAGTQITIVQRGKRLLKGFDPDLVGWLMESFGALGIQTLLSAKVEAIERAGEGFRVLVKQAGETVAVEADLVVHAAGRVPALESLDLAAAGVAVEAGRIKLNEFLQSKSNPAVYAAGDSAQVGPPLTPVSAHDGHVVADNMLNGNHRAPDYRVVPSVAFTIPPIAMVGLSEERARQSGLKFRVKSAKSSTWFTARQAAEPVYGFKTLVEEGSERVLGAHLVGPHSEEVINLFALAIRYNLTAADLKTTMFAYPSGGSDIGYML